MKQVYGDQTDDDPAHAIQHADGASAAYVLPVDKIVTISADAEVKIEMHNELRDTPKTGDDRNPTLWYALTGVGFIGAVTCTLLAVKKNKKGGRK